MTTKGPAMTDCIAVLRQHNISSRCCDQIISPRESALRAAIDSACDEIERLRSLIVDLRANASLLSTALHERVMYEDRGVVSPHGQKE